MDEYWNQFLNWISSIYQDQTPRIAPRVEDRYAESYRKQPYEDMGRTVSGVIQRKRPGRKNASIGRYISDTDTIYKEYQDNKYGTRTSPYIASNKDKNKKKYKELKDRYDRAWEIAADTDIDDVKYNRIGAYRNQAPTVGNLFNQFLEFLDIPTK